MVLSMIKDAIHRRCVVDYIALILPYLPYSRQDRVCNPGEALSSYVFGSMINNMKFNEVQTWDAHSDVGPACINYCFSLPVERLIDGSTLNEALGGDAEKKDAILISPDAGATKKTLAVARWFNGLPILQGDKIRDTTTGEITGTRLSEGDLTGKTAVIVDDICDGGMTFIKLAELLKLRNPKEIILWVTHGIFSKGIQRLFDAGIDKIYTTTSFPYPEDALEEHNFHRHTPAMFSRP